MVVYCLSYPCGCKYQICMVGVNLPVGCKYQICMVRLLAQLALKIKDKPVLKLIRAFLTSGVIDTWPFRF